MADSFVKISDEKQKPGKRLFDLVFSSSVLTFGFPFFLLCGVAVKFSSPGPMFYGSLRVGKRGKNFRLWKFRTMYADADERLKGLLKSNKSLRTEWKAYYKLKEDPRVTKLGKWMRKTSIDELPQFWNVLKGDMSLVGPRPVVEDEVKNYLKEKAPKILSMKPGLTSLWTVSGRNLVSYEERVALEESYIEKQSFWLDLLIILKTVRTIFFPKGAF
jgi:undecaprenyl-phosphate galactose phosphotransferase